MRHEFHSAHSAKRVLHAYADNVPSFAAQLPGVREVVAIEEGEASGILTRVHLWRADTRGFPSFLTSWIDPHLWEWTTTCRWDLAALEGTWELQIGVFGDATHIRGSHRFVPQNDGSLTLVEGEVLVQASGFSTVAGVPLVGPVQRALDRLIERVFREIVAKSGAVVEASLDP